MFIFTLALLDKVNFDELFTHPNFFDSWLYLFIFFLWEYFFSIVITAGICVVNVLRLCIRRIVLSLLYIYFRFELSCRNYFICPLFFPTDALQPISPLPTSQALTTPLSESMGYPYMYTKFLVDYLPPTHPPLPFLKMISYLNNSFIR